MLIMVGKSIGGSGMYHATHQYAEANKNYLENQDKNKESSYLQYWDVNNLPGQAMSQKLTVDGFTWVEETSQLKLIKIYRKLR